MAAPALLLDDPPAYGTPVITREELARIKPFVPARTLRLVQVMVDTIEFECVAPMLRQTTFVEAIEVLEKNLDVVRLVRRGALILLFSDAQKNPSLMDQIVSAPEMVRSDFLQHQSALALSEEDGAAFDRALSAFEHSNEALFEFVRSPTLSALPNSHSLGDSEALATRTEVLLIVLLTCLRSDDPAPAWMPELVRALGQVMRQHALAINRFLLEMGRRAIPRPAPELALLPNERERAINELIAAFETADPFSARYFLLEQVQVFELLLDALPVLEDAFGASRRVLTVVPGTWSEPIHLVVRIVVPNLAELAERREQFELWWDDHAHRAKGGLVISVRPS